MVLACDLRLAVPGARLFYPVMRLGYLPQPSDPVRLAALVGPARARMILMAGQKIGAEEALAWGWWTGWPLPRRCWAMPGRCARMSWRPRPGMSRRSRR